MRNQEFARPGPFIASLALTGMMGCGVQSISSGGKNCAPGTASEKTPKFMLAEGTSSPGPVGGFLVFDKLSEADLKSKPYASASRTKDELCSGAFHFREASGKFFVRATTSISCLEKFFVLGENRGILVYQGRNKSGDAIYKRFLLSDPRFSSFKAFYQGVDSLKPSPIYREGLNTFGLGGEGMIRVWLEGTKGLSRITQQDVFLKKMCYASKSTPVPEQCAWPLNMEIDEFEVSYSAASDRETLSSLAKLSQETWKSQLTALTAKDAVAARSLESFIVNLSAARSKYQRISAVAAAGASVFCDGTPDKTCDGKRTEYMLLQATHFAPDYVERLRAIAAMPDRNAADAAIEALTGNLADKEVQLPHGNPALNAYETLFSRLPALKSELGVAANHLASPKYEPGKYVYDVFKAGDARANGAMNGISFEVSELGLLVKQGPKDANQNLTRGPQDGSVVTLMGIPFLGFAPANVDQSDRTSGMALPSTTERADAPTRETKTGDSAKDPAEKGSSAKDGGC